MADELRERLVEQLSEVADIVDELCASSVGGCIGVAETAFDHVDAARWSLADYVLRGERTRRMVNAPNELVNAVVAEHGDATLARAAQDLRAAADVLASRVQHTNTVVARWLVAHRVAVANPCYLDSNALLARLGTGALEPASVSEDPLYLLVCHLQDVLAVIDDWGDPDARALQHVRAQLTLSLHAVRQEMVAAMAYHAAATGLSRTVAGLRST